MMGKKIGLWMVLLWVGCISSAWAGKGQIVFVETAVDLQATGKAVVAYTVQWQVISGELHGFYFQGNDQLVIQKMSSDSYAVDSAGNRYALDISPVSGDMWDIILADGQGVGSGTVTYVFYFETDFAEAGYLAPTTAEDGRELYVFNWSPVQWDEAERQGHYTLTIVTPKVLASGENARNWVNNTQSILTEEWVNSKFVIDYQQGPADRLQVLFHKEQPGNRFDMRTQFYMPAEWFDIAPTTRTVDAPAQSLSVPEALVEKVNPLKKQLLFGMLGLGAVFAFVVLGKHKSVAKAGKPQIGG